MCMRVFIVHCRLKSFAGKGYCNDFAEFLAPFLFRTKNKVHHESISSYVLAAKSKYFFICFNHKIKVIIL